ncbi:MAG: hypothetical protein IJ065_11250 [Eubacterium sp.]|nr:hypothetical protein [Eubacterium sp.]
MGAFLGLTGFFGMIVTLVILCVKAFKKEPKMNTAIALLGCFVLFVMGFTIDTKNKDDDNTMQAAAAVSVQEESVDRSIPEESVEDKAPETEDEITTELTTEQLAVVTTEATTEEVTTEVTTESITDATTEEITTEATTEATTEEITTEVTTEAVAKYDYILNTSKNRFHRPSCKSVKQMKEENKREFHGTREEVIGMGYVPCKNCDP